MHKGTIITGNISLSDRATVRSILCERGLSGDGAEVYRAPDGKRYVMLPWNTFGSLTGERNVIGVDL